MMSITAVGGSNVLMLDDLTIRLLPTGLSEVLLGGLCISQLQSGHSCSV